MERITTRHMTDRAAVLNKMLYGLHVEAQGRNGYFGLDLYQGTQCVRTLTTGTKREVYEYLGAMIDALEIVGR